MTLAGRHIDGLIAHSLLVIVCEKPGKHYFDAQKISEANNRETSACLERDGSLAGCGVCTD